MGEPLRELVVPVLEMAKQVTTVSQHCGPGTGRPDWNVVELWVNMQRNGSINAAHFHPGSFWAGVFYVDVGEVYSTKETGGELLMYDPRARHDERRPQTFRPRIPPLTDLLTIFYAHTTATCLPE